MKYWENIDRERGRSREKERIDYSNYYLNNGECNLMNEKKNVRKFNWPI